jgi:Putative zinc-finger
VTTTPSTHHDAEHREIWLQLPWYVNDSVDLRQRERIDAHISHCARCRTELSQQREVQAAMCADVSVELLPSASLNRLRQRLDAAPQAQPTPERAAAITDGTPQRRWQVAAAIAAVAVTLGVVMMASRSPTSTGSAAGSYRTVTDATPRPSQEAIRAVFAPDTSVARLQRMLEAAQLTIVAGPTEAGVYSLALAASKPLAAALSELRRQPEVRFAESTLQQTAVQ